MTRYGRATPDDKADDNHLLVNEAASDEDEDDSDDNQQLLKAFEERDEDDFQVIEIPSDEEDELNFDINGLGENDVDGNEESPEEDNADDKKRMLWSDPGVNVAELSDDEEDVDDNGPLRRVGNVPKQWYDHLEHIGYNVDGKPITKKTAVDAIDRFLSSQSESGRRTIYDYENDRQVTLSKDDIAMLRRIREGTYAHADFDETNPMFQTTVEKQIHPLGNAMIPSKSRFLPSKHEQRIVQRYVQALRNGWIRPSQRPTQREQQQAQATFLMWDSNGLAVAKDGDQQRHGEAPPVISAPKARLPGHAESYRPPEEYLPSEAEAEAWRQQDPSERELDFLPKSFDCLRHVPLYSDFIKERFERCLDLYMCPRKIKHKLNIDPESLLPTLPKPSSLRPFPRVLSLLFRGHTASVSSLSVSTCGQYLASGSSDGTVRVWEVSSSRCLHTLKLSAPVMQVAFNPNPQRRGILAILTAEEVRFVYAGVSSGEDRDAAMALLSSVDASHSNARDSVAEWSHLRGADGSHVVRLTIAQSFKRLSWHAAGDYLATVSAVSQVVSVLLHRISAHVSQAPFSRNRGEVQDVAFHPRRPFFFVATKRHVRIYNLQKQKLVKKLLCPAQWITSISVHPGGDHLLVGTADRRVCWYDLDLSPRPYKTLKYHNGAVRGLAFHPRFPLFASGSPDGSLHVFHGRVYSDLMQNALIVPVRVIGGHGAINDVIFHSHQPWVFAAYDDGTIRLFVP